MARRRPRRCLAALMLAASLLVGWVVPSAGAAPGDLDASFSGDGKVTTDFAGAGDSGQGVAIQSDGKIVVAGYADPGSEFAVARYRRRGGLDATFSGNGKVTTDVGVGSDSAYAVAIQSDGKIVVAGSVDNGTDTDFGVVRYKPNGRRDKTFSGDGRVRTDFGSDDEAYAIAIQPDGKIVVVGWVSMATDDFGVVRYKPNGRRDKTFSADGKVTTHFGSGADVANAIAIQGDGKIVVAGRASNGADSDFALARYKPRGRLDTMFSGDGKVVTDFGSGNDGGDGIVILPDERIVVAGWASNGADDDFAVARYKPRGRLDTSFSADGKAVTDFGFGFDRGYGVARQDDGKIVVAGPVTMATGDFGVARYRRRGALDGAFSADGKATTAIGGSGDVAWDVALQSDGRVVVAGQASMASSDFAVVRYQA